MDDQLNFIVSALVQNAINASIPGLFIGKGRDDRFFWTTNSVNSWELEGGRDSFTSAITCLFHLIKYLMVIADFPERVNTSSVTSDDTSNVNLNDTSFG